MEKGHVKEWQNNIEETLSQIQDIKHHVLVKVTRYYFILGQGIRYNCDLHKGLG